MSRNSEKQTIEYIENETGNFEGIIHYLTEKFGGNSSCLNNSNVLNTFQIHEKLDENQYFRYLRIRQNGLNCAGTYQLSICSLEFFGTII